MKEKKMKKQQDTENALLGEQSGQTTLKTVLLGALARFGLI
jgi:hypothetical protein